MLQLLSVKSLAGTPSTPASWENALPHAALGPAPEPVVKRLLRPVDMLGAITPATTVLQHVDSAGKHTPVIDPRHTARILRQNRLDPRLLLIREPEGTRHPNRLLTGDR